MKLISLTRGKIAIVDDEDFETVNSYRWYYNNSGYATREFNGKAIMMHRFILKAPPNLVVDHINWNGLDNRRENIRLCTTQQNNAHARTFKNNLSKLRGVSWYHWKGKPTWRARICFNKKLLFIGHYKTKEEAARGYNEAARRYFGEFAYQNPV